MKHIAIIGGGPRGLSALESLIKELAKQHVSLQKIKITIFEPNKIIGSSNVWDAEQPNTNWANVSERRLNVIPGRQEIKIGKITLPYFPPYSSSKLSGSKDIDVDIYPSRSKVGEYLHNRGCSLVNFLLEQQILSIKKRSIEKLEIKDGLIELTDVQNNHYMVNEALLAIGHQPIEPDLQLNDWAVFGKKNKEAILYENAYPTEKIIADEKINSESVVALRGFGLTVFDVLRALTQARGGQFILTDEKTQAYKYVRGSMDPKVIIPFSHEGAPMAPKPINEKVDTQFLPTPASLAQFAKNISVVAKGNKKVSDHHFLLQAMADVVTPIFISIKGHNDEKLYNASTINTLIISWLSDESFEHELIQKNFNSVTQTIRSFIDMALGDKICSLDYCIGQVWRHCQEILYREFSHAQVPNNIVKAVLQLDENMKRYSYGPPVASLQQLMALTDAGIVNLDWVKNPDIKLTNNGWQLSSNNKKIMADIMINCVLDAVELQKIKSPLIKNMLWDGIIQPIHSELGIETKADGIVVSKVQNMNIPVAIVGRLAEGSVVGADSLLACFGERIDQWAKGVVIRITGNAS